MDSRAGTSSSRTRPASRCKSTCTGSPASGTPAPTTLRPSPGPPAPPPSATRAAPRARRLRPPA
eukprot:784557-Prymnesium_polylepis.1